MRVAVGAAKGLSWAVGVGLYFTKGGRRVPAVLSLRTILELTLSDGCFER